MLFLERLIEKKIKNTNSKIEEGINNLNTKINSLEERVNNLSNNIEKNRRMSQTQIAVELIAKWATSIKQSSMLARKFVEELSPRDCISLYMLEEDLTVDAKHRKIIEGCVADIEINQKDLEEIKDQEGKVIKLRLSYKVVGHISWLVTSYLNILESIMIAWANGLADPKIIEDEFKYLISKEKGYYALKNYRIACGDTDTYPAIHKFASKVENDLSKRGRNLDEWSTTSPEELIELSTKELGAKIEKYVKKLKDKGLSTNEAYEKTADNLVAEVEENSQDKSLFMLIAKRAGRVFMDEGIQKVLEIFINKLKL